MKYFKSLLNNFREGILLVDPFGKINFLNKEVEAITGFSSEMLIGKPISVLYKDAGGDKIKMLYELESAEKKGKFVSPGWKSKANGDSFWGEMILSPIYEEEDTLKGFSCLILDLSEKKNFEEQLKLREQKYRLIVDGIKDYSIFFTNKEGLIKTWNEGSAIITGYPQEEALEKHLSIIYSTEDRELNQPQKDLSLANEQGQSEIKGWRVKNNGSLFWANISITKLFSEYNEFIGYSNVIQDLSEEREKEEYLIESEERYRLLVQQVRDYGIFMLDAKGRVISWNDGAQNIKGYKADEIIGKYFSIFYPKEDITAGKPARELEIAKEVGKYEEEGWRLRKNGERFWASIVITAVYNSNHVLIGFSKVTRDLTERKKLELVIRESSEKYRLLAEDLKLKNKALENANEELEQFTSVASHDLQEPIRSITGFLKLIERKVDLGEIGELKIFTEKALNASQRMRELIQNLLKYSQLSNGDLNLEVVDIEKLLNQILFDLKETIQESGTSVSIINRADELFCDPIQIRQLLINLISNAVKFTESNNPVVIIQTENIQGAIKFSVSDNGIGIPTEESNKVFEIFRRLHTTTEFPGTGIGLSICKKIVERHKGKIWFDSKPDNGTTFYFTIPESQ